MARTRKTKPNAENLIRNEHPLDKYIQNLSGNDLAILKKRAKNISKKLTASENTHSLESTLFVLSGEKYAIESIYIKETLKLNKFTVLPAAPDFLVGVFNLRGKIISIINIKEFFGLSDEKITDLNRVIVMQQNDLIFGILVDRIEGIINIDEKQLTKEITTLNDMRKKYFKGVDPNGIIVLDGNKILCDKKLIIEEF